MSDTWPIDRLSPNPHNPRFAINESGLHELAASIKAQGVLQPLLITPAGLVIAGHRRLAAARKAGLTEVPVVVRDMTVVEQQAIMLVENLQREDLSPIEEARGYKGLLTTMVALAEVARAVGVTTARVKMRLVLLNLDEVVQMMVHRGDLPLTVAPILNRIGDPDRQRRVATMAATRKLSVPELERIVDGGRVPSSAPKPTVKPKPILEVDDPDYQGDGREALLKRLQSPAIGFAVSAPELEASFREVCCACGMQDLPDLCAACPMVQLVDVLLARAAGKHDHAA